MKKNNFDIFTSFHIDKTEIAIAVKSVQEVVNYPEKVIPMPLAPDFLLGVFNLRGMVIPIINLKKLLKYSNDSIFPEQKVAIIDIEGAKVGLIFDSTSEILRISEQDVSAFGYVSENSHKIISGAIKLNNGERILQILDTNALITIENIPQILDQQKIHQNNKNQARLDMRKKCISFNVKNIKMAFEISRIHEIVKVPELKPSSIQSEIFMGIINLRGRTVPVVSFAKMLKIDNRKDTDFEEDDRRVIILKIDQELIGLMVDHVDCINSFYDEQLIVVPVLGKERAAMFLGCISMEGFGEIFLIDHGKILSNHEILEVTEGHSKIYQNAAFVESKKSINRESYISFKLDHLFGISIKEIREIINYSDDVISAPGMPFFVKGMLNLRSKLIVVIDTRKMYRMDEPQNQSSECKVLIFEKNDELFGLVVDSLESILSIDQDKKFKVPELLTKKIQGQFQDDIKEIVSVPVGEKETALIILNTNSVSERIKNLKTA